MGKQSCCFGDFAATGKRPLQLVATPDTCPLCPLVGTVDNDALYTGSVLWGVVGVWCGVSGDFGEFINTFYSFSFAVNVQFPISSN